MMNLTETLNWRYSTKDFDTEKKISAEDMTQIKALLQMSASSTNIQPWHFIIASSEEGKQRITKGTEAFQFNTSKVLEASHVVIFCSKTSADEEYLLQVLEQEDKDGRFAEDKMKQMMHGGRSMFANLHRDKLNDQTQWFEKQVYLNLGNLLLGAAILGVDAVPMEGLDFNVINEEFGLKEKGLNAIVAVSLGYRRDSDFNAKLPKSRLPQEEIITEI